MGRPLPGYRVVLLDADGQEADQGEIALPLGDRPLGLMAGYLGHDARGTTATAGEYYRTGDVAERDADGYITYIGRADDVFKSSDYRISPFELESALVEHPLIAEAAVVPSPDAMRLAVPKAFLVLRGATPSADVARSSASCAAAPVGLAGAPAGILRVAEDDLGKIRRVELRALEEQRFATRIVVRASAEFWGRTSRSQSHASLGRLAGVLHSRRRKVSCLENARCDSTGFFRKFRKVPPGALADWNSVRR
jgi:acetyl-CoA synthetase